jgi:Rrf2 family transcriptional regulator, cysteine metabolism repressor
MSITRSRFVAFLGTRTEATFRKKILSVCPVGECFFDVDRGTHQSVVAASMRFENMAVIHCVQIPSVLDQPPVEVSSQMKLSRTISYALYAITELAKSNPNVPISCTNLAATGHLPGRFLLQILRAMVAKGLVSSKNGVNGGYFLSRRGEDISLMDILDVFEYEPAKTLPLSSIFGDELRNELQLAFSKVADVVRLELQKVSLADLANASSSRATYDVRSPAVIKQLFIQPNHSVKS